MSVVQIYLPKALALNRMKEMALQCEAEGYDTDNLRLGVEWKDFLREVPNGTTVIVYSVDFFPSLMELLSTLSELQERGITLKSLQEPWLSQNVGSTTDFLLKLGDLAVLLHKNRTQQGLAKARAAGKTIGRPRKTPRNKI